MRATFLMGANPDFMALSCHLLKYSLAKSMPRRFFACRFLFGRRLPFLETLLIDANSGNLFREPAGHSATHPRNEVSTFLSGYLTAPWNRRNPT